jgi:hypothetical protein
VTAIAGNAWAVVKWLPPSSDGGAPITDYKITTLAAGTAGSAVTVPAGNTEFRVTRLTNGVLYTFSVSAINAQGAGPAGTSNAVRPDP